MVPQILPRALRPGSVVALVCPSGHVPDDKMIIAAQTAVEDMGYKAMIHPQCYRKDGYFAGSTEERLEALHESFADPRTDAIFCVRGGHGAFHLLDGLDYNLIANNPKIFMGMSDATILQWAITAQTGLITFSGPMAKVWGGPANLECQSWVKDMLEGRSKTIPTSTAHTHHAGDAEGYLWGGLLSHISRLLAIGIRPAENTPLLGFFEDINEFTLRLDTTIQTLKLAGLLRQTKGVLLGEFIDCKNILDHNRSIPEMFSDAAAKNTPLVEGLPFGHGDRHCVLPIGAKAKLSAHNGQIKLELLQRVVENAAS